MIFSRLRFPSQRPAALILFLARVVLLGGLLSAPLDPVAAQPAPPVEVALTIQTVSPNPAYSEQTVTVTLVATTATGTFPATDISINSGNTPACSIRLDATGRGQCTLSFRQTGVYRLKAVYPGELAFLPAVSPEVALTVQPKLQPNLSIVSDTPDPSFLNQTVQVGVRLTPAAPIPSGLVTIFRSATGSCTAGAAAAAVDRCTASFDALGNASCSLTLSSPGLVQLCATYPGDVAYLAGGSTPEPHFVAAGNTFTEITAVDPAPSTLGQTVWVWYRVVGTTPVPGGTVTVTDGVRQCSASVGAGRCQLTLTQPHFQNLTASYAGFTQNGTTWDPSTSLPFRQRVNAPPTAIRASAEGIDYAAAAGTVVADLTAVDPNPDETHTFSLVAGAGAEHNGQFRISGNQLVLVNGLELWQAGFLSVRVRAVDSSGLSFEQSLQFLIADRPLLPNTGFAPGRVTWLPAQPASPAIYPGAGSPAGPALVLDIPRLNVSVEIVGVALDADGWDTTWLGNQAGWLEGTAYPTWEGNSALAAHNYLPSGLPGPFAHLSELQWGDEIHVQAFGSVYVYQVRSVRLVKPDRAGVIDHKEDAWLTLITCRAYNETTQAYDQRVVVKAQLIEIR